MSVGARKSSFSLESRVQWSNTVGSTLWEVHCGKAAHVAVIPDFVLGPVEMAAAVLQCPGGSNGEGRSRTPWSECGRAH